MRTRSNTDQVILDIQAMLEPARWRRVVDAMRGALNADGAFLPSVSVQRAKEYGHVGWEIASTTSVERSLTNTVGALSISIHARRTELKSIQQKTGWHAQSEFARAVQQLGVIGPKDPADESTLGGSRKCAALRLAS
jgi:hypothetical protein